MRELRTSALPRRAIDLGRPRSPSRRRPTAPPRSCRPCSRSTRRPAAAISFSTRLVASVDARRIDRLVVGDEHDDRFAVGAETRRADAAIEILGRLHARRRACCRRPPPAPGAPCRRRRISSRRSRGTRSTCRPGSTRPCRARRGWSPASAPSRSIRPSRRRRTAALEGSRSGSVVAVAHEGDARAVGRPGRRRLVGLAVRQPIELLRRDVEQIDVACGGRTADSPARPACTCSDRSRSASAPCAASPARRRWPARRAHPDRDRRRRARAASNRATTRIPAAVP